MRLVLAFIALLFLLNGAVSADSTLTALDTTIVPAAEPLGELLLITYLQGCGCTRDASIQYLKFFRQVIIPDSKFTNRLRIRILDLDTNHEEADSLLKMGVETFLPLIRICDEMGYIHFEQSYDPLDSVFTVALNQYIEHGGTH